MLASAPGASKKSRTPSSYVHLTLSNSNSNLHLPRQAFRHYSMEAWEAAFTGILGSLNTRRDGMIIFFVVTGVIGSEVCSYR